MKKIFAFALPLIFSSAAFAGTSQAAPKINAGFNAGVEIGYDMTTMKENKTFPTGSQATSDGAKGPTFGVIFGHDWVANKIFYGLELNATYKRMASQDYKFIGANRTDKENVAIQNYTGIDAQIGYLAHPDTLFYVHGGPLYSRLRYHSTSTNAASQTTYKDGFGAEIGFGAQYAFAQHWSIRSDYAYIMYPTSKVRVTGLSSTHKKYTPRSSSITLSLIYSFI